MLRGHGSQAYAVDREWPCSPGRHGLQRWWWGPKNKVLQVGRQREIPLLPKRLGLGHRSGYHRPGLRHRHWRCCLGQRVERRVERLGVAACITVGCGLRRGRGS